jgi:hypothetical protein
MPQVSFTVSSFRGTYSSANGSHRIPVSDLRCIKSAMNVGMPLLRAGVPTSAHAVTLAVYKALAIQSAIDFQAPGAGMVWHPEYKNLDYTEKSNISYWVGMAFAGIAADTWLGVPQLLHVSALVKLRLARTSPASRSQADLLGLDASWACHVVEAKGRQRRPSQQDRDRWKVQAGTIASVGGAPPATASYCVALVGPAYCAELVDPEEIIPEPVAVTFTRRGVDLPNAVREAYYGPLRDVLVAARDAGQKPVIRGDLQIQVARVAYDSVWNRHVWVGMELTALEAVLEGRVPARRDAAEGPDHYLGSDGVALLTSPSCDIS